MALLLAILLYNYTEAAFKGVHPLWTVFFLVVWKVSASALQAPAGRAKAHRVTPRYARKRREGERNRAGNGKREERGDRGAGGAEVAKRAEKGLEGEGGQKGGREGSSGTIKRMLCSRSLGCALRS